MHKAIQLFNLLVELCVKESYVLNKQFFYISVKKLNQLT